jgi:NAD(P)-dependent dehydrogenase (short-subunit alcohol dehydrogenase family)
MSPWYSRRVRRSGARVAVMSRFPQKVVSGPIEGTEGMARLAPTEQARETVRATVPAARRGALRDVADVCLFLASSLAAYVTGVVLPADAGWSLGGASTAMAAIATQLPTTSGVDSG